jgi:hypothetical protein
MLKTSIAQLAQAVEEDGTCQSVLRFAFYSAPIAPAGGVPGFEAIVA